MYKYKILCVLVLLFLHCTQTEQVVEVIDGDTFKTADGEAVRLLGINAPELDDPGDDIAKDVLALMIYNRQVKLEKDITDRDDYDRLLRYVYVDGICVNAEMVRLGYAEARFYPPDTLHRSIFVNNEKTAVRNRRGLWSFAVFQVPDTTLSALQPVVRKETGAISWRDADQYYGKTQTVEGKIVVTNNTGKVCFLNFDRNWRKYFTAVIFASDFEKSPPHPEDHYLNRTVRVTGLIKEYQGKPEIILKSPSQIEIIQ
jgi:micrococcal nuclease